MAVMRRPFELPSGSRELETSVSVVAVLLFAEVGVGVTCTVETMVVGTSRVSVLTMVVPFDTVVMGTSIRAGVVTVVSVDSSSSIAGLETGGLGFGCDVWGLLGHGVQEVFGHDV